MDISSFDYYLPSGYIAQEPLRERDNSKLMVLNRKTGSVQHKKFYQIVEYFQPGDLLVLNNSKVVPVRIYGHKTKTGGKVEALLVNKLSDSIWESLLRPGKRVRIGTEILFSSELKGEVISKNNEKGLYLIQMHFNGNFNEILYKIGKMPTPPYIKKELNNSELYQTVYAQEEGSIAAPTAGFHFTKILLDEIKSKKMEINQHFFTYKTSPFLI